MKYLERGGEVEIVGADDFDPVRIFECGQCFRWDADENGVYTGVAMGRAARVRSLGGRVFLSGTAEDFEAVWRDYFDMDRDYGEIRGRLCIDDFMQKATDFGAGIRILRQDKWEALCSFIISQCNNIPRIKKIISALCHRFGGKFEFEGKEFCAFPTAQRIAALDEEKLACIRCGYRAAYIIGAARAIDAGIIDLDALSLDSPANARAALKTLRGVGNKVANCAALFGLHMLDSFPLDVWMKRAISEQYGPNFDPVVFSPFAGIAQQYIFHYVRNR
ncbi:MAG: DNA-3-methyladenine glycosylase 2 family protein [Oscillospiraceae bacterium]|jgi:N-glycosylase/DNA lyase|nr:DNA-3-methyladenine glycosylase 2 family protein [Oscillospiraceae bacterium]